MTGDQAIINILFEQSKSTYFSQEELAEIEAKHGEEIRRTVEHIYSFTDMGAANQDLSQSANDMQSALSKQYPWLTEKTRRTLSWMMMMTWK